MIKRLPFNFLLFTFFFLLYVGCSVDLPSDVIPEHKMENILHDYHLAQGMAEAQGDDAEKYRYLYVQKVFEKYGVTEAQFDSSMVWYSGHASHLEGIYKRLDVRLERESSEVGLNIPEEDKYARFTAEGDTANIWQGRDMLFLHGNREQNLYTLTIPADSTFHRGDYFMFRCSNRFIVQEGQREAFVLMQVRYANDSTVCATTMVSGDYDSNINIPMGRVPADLDIHSINVTFYFAFDESRDPSFRMWVIRKPVLLRYRAPEVEKSEADTLQADTLRADTLAASKPDSAVRRLSPTELRESKPVDRKINVVERRHVVLPAKPQQQRRLAKPSR